MKDTDDTDDFVVQLLRENRRLRKENERLAAIESSIESNLWWRLHPRRHLRRITTAVRLATGRYVVEDCENAGPRDGHVRGSHNAMRWTPWGRSAGGGNLLT
jgi:hypothetical protein